jgi:HEAT repeat protein
MEHSPNFARFFARLVGLLIHEPAQIDEQKVVLRAAVALNRLGAVRLSVENGHLLADGEPVLSVLPGVRDTIERMQAAGVLEILFDAKAAPAVMLGKARELAAGRVDAPIPVSTAPEPAGTPVAQPVLEAAPAESSPAVPGLLSDESHAMYYQFSVIGAVRDSPEALLARLDAAKVPAEKARLLDDAVTLAETAAREGRPEAVADLLYGLVERERVATAPEDARACARALGRMARPVMLRSVAALLAEDVDRRDRIVAVLARTGQDGAEAVIDQLSRAQTAADGRVLFDVLAGLDATVPALTHMLGDARWFVARNAADLLGELKAMTAEGALIKLLDHGDDRVRRSATDALLRLGTHSAREAVAAAVGDAAPQVRKQAAFAIAAAHDPQTATTLITAIDEETDTDVQLAMLLALGRVGTPEAVQRLIRAAEPERGLFRKKSTAFRVAAVQALAEAKSATAQAALRALASDKEKEVRDTVARLGRPGRPSGR